MQILQFSVLFFRLSYRLKNFHNKKLKEKTPCLNCCHSRLLGLPKLHAETWRRKLNTEHLLLPGALYICDFNQPFEQPYRVTVITPILQSRADAERWSDKASSQRVLEFKACQIRGPAPPLQKSSLCFSALPACVVWIQNLLHPVNHNRFDIYVL